MHSSNKEKGGVNRPDHYAIGPVPDSKSPTTSSVTGEVQTGLSGVTVGASAER